jgi:hypothetical protein
VALVAASVFLIAGLGFAAWWLTVAVEHGVHAGSWGMALLAWAVCWEGYALLQRRKNARIIGIIGAAAIAVGSSASAALVALPWLSTPEGAAIPGALRPTLVVLLCVAAAFAVAWAALVRSRPTNEGDFT